MRSIPAFFLLLAFAAGAHAEVYVCDDNGHKSYSQQPCGQDAKVVSPVGGSDGSVSISASGNTPDTALRLCKVIFRSFTIARTLAQEQVDFNSAEPRVLGFIRDHISNYRELVGKNPAFSTFISVESRNMTAIAYRSSNASLTDEELNDGIAACSRAAVGHLQDGESQPGTAPHKTGDKMM